MSVANIGNVCFRSKTNPGEKQTICRVPQISITDADFKKLQEVRDLSTVTFTSIKSFKIDTEGYDSLTVEIS